MRYTRADVDRACAVREVQLERVPVRRDAVRGRIVCAFWRTVLRASRAVGEESRVSRVPGVAVRVGHFLEAGLLPISLSS